MSSHFPQEILDLIVDFLHDEPGALKACCLVSKSWVHRTREHLFAHVEFTWTRNFKLWQKTFPDPSDSPARYTRSLSIRNFEVVTLVDTGVGDWIRTFSGVVRLHVNIEYNSDRKVSLVPLHGLSPTLKSLHLVCESSTSSSEVFGLVCSFPLLEDLALDSLDDNSEFDEWDVPSTSPRLTGCLSLMVVSEIGPIVRRLLELPSGLRFSNISAKCLREDVESMTDLVSKCSDTLKSLSISYFFEGGFFIYQLL